MANVLLVEDVDLVRMVLGRMLKMGGHDVREVEDAAAAQKVLAQKGIGVLVTDLWMRGENGLSLIKFARARYPELPIIAVTGGAPQSTTELSIDAAKTAGADRVLVKPVSKQELLDAVAAVAPA